MEIFIIKTRYWRTFRTLIETALIVERESFSGEKALDGGEKINKIQKNVWTEKKETNEGIATEVLRIDSPRFTFALKILSFVLPFMLSMARTWNLLYNPLDIDICSI